MPLVITNPIADVDIASNVAKLSSELAFLFDFAEVPAGLQAKIASVGITSMDVFSKIESSVEDFKATIKDDIGFDPKANIENKVAFAKLLNSWESSQVRGKKRQTEEAEQRIGDLPLKLPKSSHLVVRKAYKEKHGEIADKLSPHTELVEAKLQQLEEGELITEKMVDIISLADDDGRSDIGFVFQTDGAIKARRSSAKKGTVPGNTEDLRLKLKLLANAWEYVRLKSPSHPYLHKYTLDLWTTYTEHLLGDQVRGLAMDSPSLGAEVRPSWALILDYDYEFRRKLAWHFNTNGTSLFEAFALVYADTHLYQVKFLTPSGPPCRSSGRASLLGRRRLVLDCSRADVVSRPGGPDGPERQLGHQGQAQEGQRQGQGKQGRQGQQRRQGRQEGQRQRQDRGRHARA